MTIVLNAWKISISRNHHRIIGLFLLVVLDPALLVAMVNVVKALIAVVITKVRRDQLLEVGAAATALVFPTVLLAVADQSYAAG